MPYAALDDLIERAGAVEINQIADRNRSGEPNTDVVTAALEDADSIINGYVGQKYTLPFATTPKLVSTWAVSIARYTLHQNGAPEYVENDYKTAISSLKDVSRGLMVLPDVNGVSPPVSNGQVLTDIPDQVFSPEKLRGW